MITVGMNYEVLEGKQDDFEAMVAKVLAAMNDSDGHGESRLFVDVARAGSYLIVSQWSDTNAFDAFIASDRFKNVVTWGKEKILASRPSHEVYGRGDAVGQSCPAR